MNEGLLDRWRGREMGLADLVSACHELLDAMQLGSGDRRVTAWPDARTLRYYQTCGLIAPPLRYAGRQAVYGFDHLLRAVSVKLLQAEGLSLAQVQRALASAEGDQLEVAVREALQQTAQRPAQVDPTGGLRERSESLRPATLAAEPGPDATSLLAVELAPGVTVLIDSARVADPGAVLRALGRAMGPGTGRGGQA